MVSVIGVLQIPERWPGPLLEVMLNIFPRQKCEGMLAENKCQ
jgi:hypothetical protein